MHAEQAFLSFIFYKVKWWKNLKIIIFWGWLHKFRFKGTFKASPSPIKHSKVLIYSTLGAMFASVSLVSTSFWVTWIRAGSAAEKLCAFWYQLSFLHFYHSLIVRIWELWPVSILLLSQQNSALLEIIPIILYFGVNLKERLLTPIV